jgi:tetratricopeptide (TPR) repeat protein
VERTAKCWAELADLRAVTGDRTGALDALGRATSLGARLDDQPELTGDALLWRGEREAAARAFSAALALRPASPGDWWADFIRAKLELGLARTGDRAAKTATIELLEPLVRAHPAAVLERRLAEARAL